MWRDQSKDVEDEGEHEHGAAFEQEHKYYAGSCTGRPKMLR